MNGTMLLLTWHGTIVCLREGGLGLVHLPLPLADADASPVELDPGTPGPLVVQQTHPALGPIGVRLAPTGRGLCLTRYGRYLCADQGRAEMAFDRSAPNVWESFLPVTAHDLQGLEYLLAHRWIVAGSRQVLRRSEVTVGSEFKLRLGRDRIPLAECLPWPRWQDAVPERFTIPRQHGAIELVQAEPRSSALLQTDRWPVRARRNAEIMTLAVHRALVGREPEQAVFEDDTAFLLDRGPTGLADLLEWHDPRNVEGAPGEGARGETVPLLATAPVQPVVSLGSACVVACMMRRVSLDQAPMPFDWLGTNPAMVRHCLETDFATLLDRTAYRSLTGQGGAGEPKEGCAHAFYAAEFGIRRVFNHNDPTRDADYRYTEACVDRLRDLLASDAPKLFVQVGEIHPGARTDFEATGALLDRLTRNASLVQVAVTTPDRRQAVPGLTVVVRQEAHTLYRLQPTSQLKGDAFAGERDSDLLAGLIASHASRPWTTRLVAPQDRMAVQAACLQFSAERPERPEPEDEAARLALFERANASLRRFLETAGLPRRFRFASFDRTKTARHLTGEACLVHLTGPHPAGQQAALRFDIGARDPWQALYRALPLIYLLDAACAAGPIPETRVFGEFGDRAYERRSLTFCSSLPDSCLLPDTDFFATGGYDQTRREVAASAVDWADRRPSVFWRGSTTGRRRHEAPADGQEDDFTWLPRLDLCQRARRSALSAHYDVGISNICQIGEPHLVSRIGESGLCRPSVPRVAFLAHKAILVIDGNSNAWSALFCALLTGSCVLKIASAQGFAQWYYPDLQPWAHFVPVSESLDDLDEKVAWLLSHDDEAHAIGRAGRALAEAMTFDTVMQDAAVRLRVWLSQAPAP